MNNLSDHYEGFYGSSGRALSEWRRLGGADKALNVVKLWNMATGTSRAPTVVDIGCGDGAVAQHLAEYGFCDRIDGYELAPTAVVMARERQIPNAHFYITPDGAVPPSATKYDLAILSHVIEHADDPRFLLRQAARVARYVYVEVPLELTIRLGSDFKWTDVGHINFYNPILIRQLVQSTELEVCAEDIADPSLDAIAWKHGWRGRARWMFKHLALRARPSLATKIFVYHGCLIARSSEELA